jgi:hypothetical protein
VLLDMPPNLLVDGTAGGGRISVALLKVQFTHALPCYLQQHGQSQNCKDTTEQSTCSLISFQGTLHFLILSLYAATARPHMQGAYCLTLEFASKLELSVWEDRQPKIQSFFGPGGSEV